MWHLLKFKKKKKMIRHNKIYKMIDFFTYFHWESNPSIRPEKYCLHSFSEYKPVRKT